MKWLLTIFSVATTKEITNALYFGSFANEQKHGFERVLKPLHVPSVQLKNGRENNLIYSMLLHRIKTENLDVDIEQVLSYGCWCNFETTFNGRGAPLDAFDKVCQKWAQCTKCIEMDKICHTDETGSHSSGEYDIKITKYDNSFTCNMNDDKCTRSYCQCDSHMVDELVTALKEDKLNRDYVHLFGRFSPDSCQITGSGGANPDQCCGEYPNRYPFVSRDGIHKCCGSKLFNSDYNDCCDDGQAI